MHRHPTTRRFNRTPSRLPRDDARRGAILFLVLMTGLVIATISLGGLIVQTTQFQGSRMSGEAIAARVAASSAAVAGTQRVAGDSAWRSKRTPGDWYSDVALGGGTWSLHAADPVDADFNDNRTDSLSLTATADVGDAVQRAVSVLPTTPMLRPELRAVAVSGQDLRFSDADVETAGWLRAAGAAAAAGSCEIQADVSAVSGVSGSGFQHRVRTGAAFSGLPQFADFADVMDAGVSVALNAVPLPAISGVNLVRNADLNQGESGWAATGTALLTSSSYGGDGGSPCGVLSARSSATDGVVVDITSGIRNGRTLAVDASVLPLLTRTEFRVSVVVETDTGTAEAAAWVSPELSAGILGIASPRGISASMTPVWTGRLKSAWLKFRTEGSGLASVQDFAIDRVTCRLVSPPASPVLYRELITPAASPFGSTTSPDAIYVIDCQGQDVRITDTVIVGTLCCSDAGTVTVGPGPVHWRPARPGLPALITDGELVISISRQSVSEYELARNFNPAGSPDSNGISDSRTDDSYPSELQGLIFAAGSLTFAGDVRIRGTVLTRGDLGFSQRVTLHPAPEHLTVPLTATWSLDTLSRPANGVQRLFD